MKNRKLNTLRIQFEVITHCFALFGASIFHTHPARSRMRNAPRSCIYSMNEITPHTHVQHKRLCAQPKKRKKMMIVYMLLLYYSFFIIFLNKSTKTVTKRIRDRERDNLQCFSIHYRRKTEKLHRENTNGTSTNIVFFFLQFSLFFFIIMNDRRVCVYGSRAL